MADLLSSKAARPGCREVSGLHIATLRHLPDDRAAAACVAALALPWPLDPGVLAGDDPYLAWRSPTECLLIGTDAQPVSHLLETLAPGRSETAMACEMAEALAVFELYGPKLDDWLCHLVDSLSIPRERGRSSRARMVDIPVLLLRLRSDQLWLLADRTIAPYIRNWLTYSHEGAFADSDGP